MQLLKLISIAVIIVLDVGAVIYLIFTMLWPKVGALAEHYQTLMLVLIAFVQLGCGSALLMFVASYRERAKQELQACCYR